MNQNSDHPSKPVTVAHGDGIGPEIMGATLRILEAAGARIVAEPVDLGEKVFLGGNTSGIPADTWESIRRTRVMLKAPITTPQGKGYKSVNVPLRKTLGLFANVRPCVTYHPFVRTFHPGMNLVIIRENEEDLYAGIEHRQTQEVTQCLKLITRPGCERIVRYAFEYARANKRRKVTCFSKDNIMKITDGLFHRVFDEIAQEYPDLQNEHWIVDIGTALIADRPDQFDVVVMPNLYGDIVSDVAAQVAGSVGIAGSSNIGEGVAMFEAIHGSAPTIAGKDIANPSALLQAAIMMLVHIGQGDVAGTIHNAWLRTLEDGVHTADIYQEGRSVSEVGTQGFADAVIKHLGSEPEILGKVSYAGAGKTATAATPSKSKRQAKELVGVDVFLDWDDDGRDPEVLGERLTALEGSGLRLKMITNRGIKVFPGGASETFCSDHWRCRFVSADEAGTAVGHASVVRLLDQVREAGLDFIKTENLYTFDGELGYSLGQGE
jgi:isocitrate dehydrogenase